MKRNDPGHEETDKELAKLEKQISKEYTQAYKDVKKKFEKYMKDFARKDKVKRELVKSGQLSQEEYIEWRKNQLLVGQRWEEMRDALAKDITNTQRIATSMTKEFLPDAYAINHNYGTFEVEKGSHINTSYTLYDRDTVNRLIRDNPKLLPAPKVDIPKAQLWNKRKLTSAITQGVLQGEAIPAIAKRLMTVTDMSKSAAIRNARTMTTSAECAGRIDSYKRAEDMGIEMQQAWVATLDDRTRHEHRLLDGQIRPVGEPFEVEGQKIMYPGDPEAEPYLVYNCRCTVIALVKGTSLENGIGDYPRIIDPKLGDMTYEEWKGVHEEEQQAEEKDVSFVDKIKKIQQRVKDKGWVDESDLHEAGGLIATEFRNYKNPAKEGLKNARDSYVNYLETSGYNSLLEKRHELMVEQKAYRHDRRGKEFIALGEKISEIENKKRRIEQGEEYKKLRETILRLEKEYKGTEMDNATWLRGILSQIREVGCDGMDMKSHLKSSRSPARKIVEEAYSFYPTEWVRKSIAKSTLTPQIAERGYYSEFDKVIAISGRNHDKQFSTAIHELGHRFEKTINDILVDESEFYERRTDGETLEWLGYPFSRSEKTRKDKFVDSYMGKDYNGSAYELVSMGFQLAYTEPTTLSKDSDMESWIYGILALE